MPSRKWAIAMIGAGAILSLGPVWGVIGTVLGMTRAFGTLAQSGPPSPEKLASDISVALYSTVAGLAMHPIGLALLILGIIRNARLRQAASRRSVPPPGAPSVEIDAGG